MKAKTKPVLEGTKLGKARLVIDRREKKNLRSSKEVIALDADCQEYKFDSTAAVQRETGISAPGISRVINLYKKGKKEVPLFAGFCWIYTEDVEEYGHKVKAWIALNAADTRKTTV